MIDPKIANFTLIQTPYKTINDHEIRTDILIPKSQYTGKRPIIVRYHGGGLIMGDSLFMIFYPHWVSDLALQHNAIIVSPNYRLLPESTSPEIYKDIDDFWTWLRSPTFATLLSTHSTPTEADLDRILLAGDSAGGLLSVYTALKYPREIRSATASYPWIDPSSEHFRTAHTENPPFGRSTPVEDYDEYMAVAKIGTPKSSFTAPESMGFMLAAAEYGHLAGLYERGTEGVSRDILYPGVKIEAGDLEFPRGGIAIIHGKQDTVVPLSDVEMFVEKAQSAGEKLELSGPGVSLTIRDGDHGFDSSLRYSDEEWMQEAFNVAVDTWLE